MKQTENDKQQLKIAQRKEKARQCCNTDELNTNTLFSKSFSMNNCIQDANKTQHKYLQIDASSISAQSARLYKALAEAGEAGLTESDLPFSERRYLRHYVSIGRLQHFWKLKRWKRTERQGISSALRSSSSWRGMSNE